MKWLVGSFIHECRLHWLVVSCSFSWEFLLFIYFVVLVVVVVVVDEWAPFHSSTRFVSVCLSFFELIKFMNGAKALGGAAEGRKTSVTGQCGPTNGDVISSPRWGEGMLPIFGNRSPRDQTRRRNETRQLVWSCDSSLKMIWISVPPFWSVNYRSIALGISGVASIFTVWSRWNVWCDTICFAWWLSFYLLTAVWWSELNKSRRDRFHSAILTAAILFSFLSRSYFVRFRLFVCFYFYWFFFFVSCFHFTLAVRYQFNWVDFKSEFSNFSFLVVASFGRHFVSVLCRFKSSRDEFEFNFQLSLITCSTKPFVRTKTDWNFLGNLNLNGLIQRPPFCFFAGKWMKMRSQDLSSRHFKNSINQLQLKKNKKIKIDK